MYSRLKKTATQQESCLNRREANEKQDNFVRLLNKFKISILLYQIERKTARICLENPLYLQKKTLYLGK